METILERVTFGKLATHPALLGTAVIPPGVVYASLLVKWASANGSGRCVRVLVAIIAILMPLAAFAWHYRQ